MMEEVLFCLLFCGAFTSSLSFGEFGLSVIIRSLGRLRGQVVKFGS